MAASVAVDDVEDELPLVNAPDREEDLECEVGVNGDELVSHTRAGRRFDSYRGHVEVIKTQVNQL